MACRRSDSDGAIDCQQGEAKRGYRGFVTVHCSSFSFFLEEWVFLYLSVELRVIAFHVIIY